MAGFDAVVDGFGAWEEDKLDGHVKTSQHLCDILSGTDTRLLIVGGAGSLYVNPEHTAIDYFGDHEKVTSSFLAGSVGANPVIVRNVMGNLKEAGIIDISQGKSGIALAKKLEDITFYEVYKAVDGRLDKVQQSMESEMKQITLNDVVDDTRRIIMSEKA